MKTILLPTDFSRNSVNAIHYAMDLYKNDPCNFYILNVQKASSFISDDMMVVNSSVTIYATIVDAAKKSINNIIQKIKEQYHNDKHHFEVVVDYDNFVDSINQVSELYNVDLIIMGTKGASDISKTLFGSNTIKVIQRGKVPVLAVPENCKYSDLDKIAFATSYRNLYNMDNLKLLKYFVDANRSKLYVIHALSSKNYLEELNKNVDLFKQNFKFPVFKYLATKNNHIYKAIHEFSFNNDIKMIALFVEKHSFFERLFTVHTFEMIANNIDIPFLIMKRT